MLARQYWESSRAGPSTDPDPANRFQRKPPGPTDDGHTRPIPADKNCAALARTTPWAAPVAPGASLAHSVSGRTAQKEAAVIGRCPSGQDSKGKVWVIAAKGSNGSPHPVTTAARPPHPSD